MKITKTEYLYGLKVDSQKWATMGYKEVLELKIDLAYERITKLNKVHYMDRDFLNVNDCARAMSFCRNLLKEIK